MEPEIAGKNPCAYGEKRFQKVASKKLRIKNGVSYPLPSTKKRKQEDLKEHQKHMCATF